MNMNMKKSNSLYLLLFVILTIFTYYSFFLVDQSSATFSFIRIIAMLSCYFYFNRLTKQVSLFQILKEKIDAYPSAKNQGAFLITICLFLSHLILMNVGGEKLNEILIKTDHHETTATIISCYTTKGSEYCKYAYIVDNKKYEIKFLNDPSILNFKEQDTTTIVYFAKAPVLSKLKKELQKASDN